MNELESMTSSIEDDMQEGTHNASDGAARSLADELAEVGEIALTEGFHSAPRSPLLIGDSKESAPEASSSSKESGSAPSKETPSSSVDALKLVELERERSFRDGSHRMEAQSSNNTVPSISFSNNSATVVVGEDNSATVVVGSRDNSPVRSALPADSGGTAPTAATPEQLEKKRQEFANFFN